MLSGLEITIIPGLFGESAGAYYHWTVTLGAGETPGENVFWRDSGGQDFSSPGVYMPNPGTVANYSYASLSLGVYWMTTDFKVGVEALEAVPEPATLTLMSTGALLIRTHRRSTNKH